MNVSFKLTPSELILGLALGGLPLLGLGGDTGEASTAATEALLLFSGFSMPLMAAAFWWRAPRATDWLRLAVAARYGASRRREAMNMEVGRLATFFMAGIFFTWAILLLAYPHGAGNLGSAQQVGMAFDAQTTVPLVAALLFAQAGFAAAARSWLGKWGLIALTCLSVGVGMSFRASSTIFPADLAKSLLGGAELANPALATTHLVVALLVLGLAGVCASLLRVAP